MVLAEARSIVVDDVPEDERIQQREDLIRRRQHQREQDYRAVFGKVGVK
jgi:hypothetical protein